MADRNFIAKRLTCRDSFPTPEYPSFDPSITQGSPAKKCAALNTSDVAGALPFTLYQVHSQLTRTLPSWEWQLLLAEI